MPNRIPSIKKLLQLFHGKVVWTLAFVICFVVVFLNVSSGRSFEKSIMDFEAGKVADRDVIAETAIIYRDEKATASRIEAQEKLIPAVFVYSSRVTEELRGTWSRFSALALTAVKETGTPEAFAIMIHSEFPMMFSDELLYLLYRMDNFDVFLLGEEAILDSIMSRGIFSLTGLELERFNPGVVELMRPSSQMAGPELIPFNTVLTMNNFAAAFEAFSAPHPSISDELTPVLLEPFIKENVFYSHEETARRIVELKTRVEPVMRSFEPGERIIRKGFVVTEEEIEELNALRLIMPENNIQIIVAYLLFMLLIFGLLIFFSGKRIISRLLNDRETYLVSGLSALYIAGSVFVKGINLDSMPASVVVPTALVIMLPAILINFRLALMLALTLPLGAFLTGSFDTQSYIFALVSGVVAARSLHGAEKRMDLIKAGLIIAAANLVAMAAVLLWQRSPASVYPTSLFWAAFNGIASGMLVLGFLPPLEHALNAATSFRLIELSDLNAPILRRLFTVAPGTYSHSIMVANLAEAACQDIGANSLLARVGAYYHDLGKMENPGYFVENQSDSNPHDDMNPRLSATVIRSHVKLGVEKARSLGLPKEVINIIGEHHGNSVITWFYSKALKQEEPKKAGVNIEDFCYPGKPPHSKESAVVMLADIAEASVRSIVKPTAQKMEKMIQELFASKVEHGQLAESELSFRDLEAIKNAFIRVLAGYYHSRIEYPKIELEHKENQSETKEAAVK